MATMGHHHPFPVFPRLHGDAIFPQSMTATSVMDLPDFRFASPLSTVAHTLHQQNHPSALSQPPYSMTGSFNPDRFTEDQRSCMTQSNSPTSGAEMHNFNATSTSSSFPVNLGLGNDTSDLRRPSSSSTSRYAATSSSTLTSQTPDSRFASTRKNPGRREGTERRRNAGALSSSMCSRASYMCRKCKTHGQNIPVKRHKRACPYMNCTCLKCHLVDQGRKVVARQIALYRDQKSVPSSKHSNARTGRNCSATTVTSTTSIEWSQHRGTRTTGLFHKEEDETNIPRHKRSNFYLTNDQEGSPNFPPSMDAMLGGGDHDLMEEDVTSGKQTKELGIVGPHCRRCRNHSLAVTWKGHKKACPFRNCPCDPCRLINVRKDTEKTLREMVGHSNLKSQTSGNPLIRPIQQSSTLFQDSFEGEQEVLSTTDINPTPTLMDQTQVTTRSHRRLRDEGFQPSAASVNKLLNLQRSEVKPTHSSQSSSNYSVTGSMPCDSVYPEHDSLPVGITKATYDEDLAPPSGLETALVALPDPLVNGKYDRTQNRRKYPTNRVTYPTTQPSQSSWSSSGLERLQWHQTNWPLYQPSVNPETGVTSQTMNNGEQRGNVATDWLLGCNPLSMSATVENKHYHHHHHHHHLHITPTVPMATSQSMLGGQLDLSTLNQTENPLPSPTTNPSVLSEMESNSKTRELSADPYTRVDGLMRDVDQETGFRDVPETVNSDVWQTDKMQTDTTRSAWIPDRKYLISSSHEEENGETTVIAEGDEEEDDGTGIEGDSQSIPECYGHAVGPMDSGFYCPDRMSAVAAAAAAAAAMVAMAPPLTYPTRRWCGPQCYCHHHRHHHPNPNPRHHHHPPPPPPSSRHHAGVSPNSQPPAPWPDRTSRNQYNRAAFGSYPARDLGQGEMTCYNNGTKSMDSTSYARSYSNLMTTDEYKPTASQLLMANRSQELINEKHSDSVRFRDELSTSLTSGRTCVPDLNSNSTSPGMPISSSGPELETMTSPMSNMFYTSARVNGTNMDPSQSTTDFPPLSTAEEISGEQSYLATSLRHALATRASSGVGNPPRPEEIMGVSGMALLQHMRQTDSDQSMNGYKPALPKETMRTGFEEFWSTHKSWIPSDMEQGINYASQTPVPISMSQHNQHHHQQQNEQQQDHHHHHHQQQDSMNQSGLHGGVELTTSQRRISPLNEGGLDISNEGELFDSNRQPGRYTDGYDRLLPVL